MAFRNFGAPNGRKRIKYDTDDLFGTPDSPPITPSPIRRKQRPVQTVQMQFMQPSQSSSSPLASTTSSPLATASASPSPPLPPPRNHVRFVAQPIDDDFTQLPPVMRYMKQRLIGCGSYGRVFIAKDQHNNEIVAIKTLSLNNDVKLKEVIAFVLYSYDWTFAV